MFDRTDIPRSKLIRAIEWLGERIGYPEPEIMGDTFPLTWADDDLIYTSCGDPLWGETKDGLDVQKFTGGPTDYKITKVCHMNDYRGWGGNGPKPTGMICVGGLLYLAFQNLCGLKEPPFSMVSQHGSDAHIVYCTNKTWGWVPALSSIAGPMFPGHQFGGPSFINFGRNNADARDEFVYAVSGDQWDNGSNLRLGRVPADRIIRREEWQWVAAWTPAAQPVWSRRIEEAIPVLSVHRCLGAPEMVYLASIRRYLLLTWRLHEDFSPTAGTDLLVFESPEPWGPFALVHFEEYWESRAFNPYCPRLPLKWIEPDGLTGWLQFSGSWGPAGQEAGYYRSNVRRFRLVMV